MKVASKFALITWLAFVPVLGLHGWLSVRRQEAIFRSDMERHLSFLGEYLARIAAAEWPLDGARGLRALIESASRADRRVQIKWKTAAGDKTPGGLIENGLDRIVWSEPLEIDGRRFGRLELSESLSAMHAFLHFTLVRIALLSAALGIAGTLLASLMGHRLIGRRLDSLVAFAGRVGAGRLGERTDLTGRDEISLLASRLDEMSEQLAIGREQTEAANAERLSLLQELRHEDRLATVGRLAGGVAHELGTPLNVVMGHAERLATGSPTPGEIEHATRVIRRSVERMTETIHNLLGFVRSAPSPTKRLDPVEVVESVCGLVAPLASQRRIDLALTKAQPGTRVRGNGVQLEQALSNLVVNAIDASSEGGRVEVSVERVERVRRVGGTRRRMIAICIRDWGVGVDESKIERLFEPFFTSKPEGSGTGLGLWLAQGIADDHGGWIDVAIPPDGGSSFTLMIPEDAP